MDDSHITDYGLHTQYRNGLSFGHDFKGGGNKDYYDTCVQNFKHHLIRGDYHDGKSGHVITYRKLFDHVEFNVP